MRPSRQRCTIYSVRDDLANGRAAIVPKDGVKQTTECWQVFGQVISLTGERLPFVACRRCLVPYADDPSGSTGNLIRHLTKCENLDSSANQTSPSEMNPISEVLFKAEPPNENEMDEATDSNAFTLSSITQEDAQEATVSVRDQAQPAILTPRIVKERLIYRDLKIVPKEGVKQTTECWQVIGQVATMQGVLLPFLACRRCLQVYSDDPNGSTSTLNRHLLKCTAAANDGNDQKMRSPKEELPEERPTSSSISLQDADMLLSAYQDQDDGQEEVELDQAQSIGLAAIDVLFGANPSSSSLAKATVGGEQWSCEVAGCPLTFLTRNGMLKHCRKKHFLSKRSNARPYPGVKPATILVGPQEEAAAVRSDGVVMESGVQPTSSTAHQDIPLQQPRFVISSNVPLMRFRCSIEGCPRQFLTANGMRKHRRKSHSGIKQADGRSIRWASNSSANDSRLNGSIVANLVSKFQQSTGIPAPMNASSDFYGQDDALTRATTSSLFDSFAGGANFIVRDSGHQATSAATVAHEAVIQHESHSAEANVARQSDPGAQIGYFVDPLCHPSAVSVSPPVAPQAPAAWLEEVSAALQAIRACAVACQNSERGRQRISNAVDELWDVCDKARRDAKLEKQRALQSN